MIVGIDFSTYEAVLVGIPAEGQPWVDTVKFRKASQTGDDAATEALRHVRHMLLASPLYHAADVFFIERGFGASRRSDFIMGAFFGIIFSTCAQQAPTNLMLAGEWKKAISASCGLTTKKGVPGIATLPKAEAHTYVQQAAYDNHHDISTYGPDAIDAYAIALTGHWACERSTKGTQWTPAA